MALVIPPRWKQTADLIAEWQRPLDESDGLPLADIEAAERRLGFRLPEALREWHLLAGRRAARSNESGLYPLSHITLRDNFVVFYHMIFPDTTWGYSLEDANLDDPDILVDMGLIPFLRSKTTWMRSHSSLNQFLFGAYLLEFSQKSNHFALSQIEIIINNFCVENFKKLYIPKMINVFHEIEIYLTRDAIIETHRGYRGHWLRVGAKSEQALREAMEPFDKLGAVWELTSLAREPKVAPN
jgi:hypothetical protein